MGDNMKINILKKLQNNKKSDFVLVPKERFYFVCPTGLHKVFKPHYPEFEKRKYHSDWCFCDTDEVHFALVEPAKK
jgi:alkyl hydroperoxide reductase subunit AhpC